MLEFIIPIELLSLVALTGFLIIGIIMLLGFRKLRLSLLFFFSFGFFFLAFGELIMIIGGGISLMVSVQSLEMYALALSLTVLLQIGVRVLSLLIFGIGILRA